MVSCTVQSRATPSRSLPATGAVWLSITKQATVLHEVGMRKKLLSTVLVLFVAVALFVERRTRPDLVDDT